MEKRQYELCLEILRRFNKAGILKDFILIGSWSAYFYNEYFTGTQYLDRAALKTRDIDFLIDNPAKIKHEVNVPELLSDLGFVVIYKGNKGYIKLEHPDLLLEFLVPEKGRGMDEPFPLPNGNNNREYYGIWSISESSSTNPQLRIVNTKINMSRISGNNYLHGMFINQNNSSGSTEINGLELDMSGPDGLSVWGIEHRDNTPLNINNSKISISTSGDSSVGINQWGPADITINNCAITLSGSSASASSYGVYSQTVATTIIENSSIRLLGPSSYKAGIDHRDGANLELRNSSVFCQGQEGSSLVGINSSGNGNSLKIENSSIEAGVGYSSRGVFANPNVSIMINNSKIFGGNMGIHSDASTPGYFKIDHSIIKGATVVELTNPVGLIGSSQLIGIIGYPQP